MVARAFDEGWIDFYPRDGKSGGAFCAGVECIGQSRILTNFDGTFGDIVTLAHELGHAFHNQSHPRPPPAEPGLLHARGGDRVHLQRVRGQRRRPSGHAQNP